MKVVVGYDGSDHARRALSRAEEMAGPEGDLVVVASAEPDVEAPLTEGGRRDPSESEQRRRALAEARSALEGRGDKAQFIEAYGDPGSAILGAAEDADLIVVGSRGLNRLERLLMGSVSTKVVQRAKCDVLVTR